MIAPRRTDDATLMRIYKEALTHTLEAAVRAVYERGLHDGLDAAEPPTPPASAVAAPPLAASRTASAK